MSLQEFGRQLTEEIATLFVELGDSNLPEEVHLLHRQDEEGLRSRSTEVEVPH